MTDYSYQIDPRPADLGGGWRLRLLEDGEEVGGGVFPASNDEESKQAAYQQAFMEANIWVGTRHA